MQHLVPEQMFSTETEKAQGISAVKALTLAAQEGQKIWTIDQGNLDVALSQINLDRDTETEIRNAVLAGKIATAHENQINFNGWVGEGYILLDPETGAGAYKITGGGNGNETIIEDSLNFLWSTILNSVNEIGEASDKFAVKVYSWVSTVLEYLKIFSSCWNTFELIVLVVFAFTLFFLASMFLAIIISVLLRVVVGALISLLVGKGVSGLRKQYCG